MTRPYLLPAFLAVLAAALFTAGFSHPLAWWAWPVIASATVCAGVAAVGFVRPVDPPHGPQQPAQDPVWPAQHHDQEAA